MFGARRSTKISRPRRSFTGGIPSSCRNNQACPPNHETHAADGRDGPEPMRVLDHQQIKRAGEEANADEKTPPRHFRKRFALCQHKQHYRVDEMIKHGLIPNGRRAILREQLLKPMRTERAQHHGEQSHRRGNAGGKDWGHLVAE